jgi:acetyl-CoA C-acetyltransferase
MTDAYIFDAVRTPRGAARDGGSLRGVKPIDLLAPLFRAIADRSGLDTSCVEDVVLGCASQTGEQGSNLAKIASLYAGWSESISGVTLNRFCASGLDAIQYASMKVIAGVESLVVAGGVESISRVPMFADGGSWFADPVVAAETRFVHMGIAADLVATLGGFGRDACDAVALESHTRSARARDQGRFARSIVPVQGAHGMLDRDEAIRDGITAAKLAKLPPAFTEVGAAGGDRIALGRYPQLRAIDHVHTAATSPALVDGASLVLVGDRAYGESLGLRPRARVRAMANLSVEPVRMLTGAAPALRKALGKAGMQPGDLDIVEYNESFAASVLDFARQLELDPSRLNVNGGALAMGHPLGATGGILVGMLVDELERRGAATGAVAICAGAGIASALVIERV